MNNIFISLTDIDSAYRPIAMKAFCNETIDVVTSNTVVMHNSVAGVWSRAYSLDCKLLGETNNVAFNNAFLGNHSSASLYFPTMDRKCCFFNLDSRIRTPYTTYARNYAYMRTYIHTHVNAHTYIFTPIHTPYIHTHTCARTRTQPCTLTFTHMLKDNTVISNESN